MVLGAAGAAVLAFDVGGTDIKAGLVDADGNVLGVRRVPTPLDRSQPGEAILDRLAVLARELDSEFPAIRAKAAGVIVPGIVDAARGVGIYSANLGWRDFPFAAEAEQRFGLPVAFDHDVRSAAAVEHRFGASKDFSEVVVMVVGTGIAAAVFSGGQAVSAGGFAGELGHALVPDPDSPPSSTILEAVGSAGAIARRYNAVSETPLAGAKEVLGRAKAGEPLASRIWQDAIDALAFTICQCVNIVGTEAVVIGGGLAEAGDDLLEPLRQRVDRTLDFQRRPRLLKAQLGQDAGLLGAAMNARALMVGNVVGDAA
ncbi:ROK family protein [Paenarthrobacter sp. S56]|uniref:ROK family protein n=1 Tax=Paenarthrobacter sp. S56 TaxID=3138179 RepID=UPI00321B1DCD